MFSVLKNAVEKSDILEYTELLAAKFLMGVNMRRGLFSRAAAIFLFLALPVLHAANANCQFLQKAKLNASGGAPGANFGFSLAVSANGRISIIGAYEKKNQCGAAYVFTRGGTGWKERQELSPLSGNEQEAFGWSVALSGNGGTAIVGAIGKDMKAGAAYVFSRTGTSWKLQRKLKASDGAAGDNFGFSLALSADGGTVIIGAPAADSFHGRAYVFMRTGSRWIQKQELSNPDSSAYDEFASAVAISADGSTALIGAYEKNGQIGSVYVFRRSKTAWKEQQELTPPVSDEPEAFGWSVALNSNGTAAIIGAIGKNAGAGAAYVFKRNGTAWKWQRELTVSGKEIFGTSVALSGDGDTALVGANGKNDRAGAVYVFTSKDGIWTQKQVLSASDAAANGDFGVSVALSAYGDTALVGSLANSAYAFSIPLQPPNWNNIAPYMKTLFGVTDNGEGIAILQDGEILHILPSVSSDPVFLALDRDLPQVLKSIQLYQGKTAMSGPGSKNDGNITPVERKKILDMAAQALKNMLQSIEKNKGQKK